MSWISGNEQEALEADRKRKAEAKAGLVAENRAVLKGWIVAKWPQGLPQLWVIHATLLGAGLTVERTYRPYGGAARVRLVRLNVGSMRWLSNELKAIGMSAAQSEPGEGNLSVAYRRKLATWSGRLRAGPTDIALAELRHSCNKYMESIRYGHISSKVLGMHLRANGWNLQRRSDGTWVLQCNM